MRSINIPYKLYTHVISIAINYYFEELSVFEEEPGPSMPIKEEDDEEKYHELKDTNLLDSQSLIEEASSGGTYQVGVGEK